MRQVCSTFAVLMAGCSPALSPPDLTDIEPAWGYNGEETTVTIRGDGLIPGVRLVASDPSSASVDAQFTAALVQEGSLTPLEGVSLDTYGALSARVPRGIVPGLYSVQVIAPGGEQDTLANAFTVTDTRADHLAIQLDARAYDVNETVIVEISLLDPDDDVVALDLPVVVEFSSETNAAGVTIDEGGLIDQLELDDRVAVSGRLDPDGTGWVAFTSAIPDNLWVTVTPAETDSPVRDDAAFVPFTPGELDRVRIDLPSEPYQAVAGEPFPVVLTLRDEFGNLLDDQAATVYLREACGGNNNLPTVDIVGGRGSTLLEVHRATDVSPSSLCPANALTAYGGATGSSQEFQVSPAEVEELTLLVAGGQSAEVTAGEPELNLIVQASDPYGNLAHDYQRALHFTDDLGGLDSDNPGQGQALCRPWNNGLLSCDIAMNRAAAQVVITADDGLGVSGRSSPVLVNPGPPTSMDAASRASQPQAGQSYSVAVRVLDAWGNDADVDPSGPDRLEVIDPADSTSCAYSRLEASGAHLLDCATTHAAEAITLLVEMPSHNLSTTTGRVDILNGPLDSVILGAPVEVTAGASFTISAEALDAYGNPYATGFRDLDISDTTGTLSIATVTLDGAGTASESVSITGAADPTVITVSSGGQEFGSVDVVVVADSVDHFDVVMQRPWAWVGEATAVTIVAQDGYDNTVADYSDEVTITSSRGLFVSERVSSFDAGQADVELTWDTPGISDRVRIADDGGVTGSSTAIDALDGECASPPTAGLLLDGLSETASCIFSGQASVTADFSTSAAGAADISHFHLSDSVGGFTRTASSSTTLSFDTAGLYRPELVVVDDDACGVVADAVVWVNEKGYPAGAITIGVADPTRTAGGAPSDADTTVSFAAVDCAGDPAANVDLYLRTDLGEFASGLTATGSGLAVTLNSAGEGSVMWSAQNTDHDGTATISAGVLSGAAFGADTLTVEGDNTRPEVAWIDPSGVTDALVDEVTIGFTEPMDDVDYDSRVALSGPDGAVTVSTSLSAARTELTVTPDHTLDGAVGGFLIELSSDVRDDSGNRMAGRWGAGVADFTSRFGAVGDEGLSVSACTPSVAHFTPDGDDGAAEEADDVDLAVSATATPSYWVLEVFDGNGDRVRTKHSAASASSTTLTWSGRADNGVIVPAGTYTVSVSTVDIYDNLSTGCEVEVVILERYSATR
ncbi:MAG: Ig-like domain-containing protein [Alphaproteobacteria bacterium]|nr:Ig-like domain-containing protein [Alphaproteobacteria bacterium]